CASCTRQGEQCEFEEPASGVWQDTWRAACIAAEQGWDRDWVAAQLEEGRKGRVLGRGSGAGKGEWVSMPAMKVGPLQGGRREGAPSMQEKGKRRASPSPKVGPSKRARGEQELEVRMGHLRARAEVAEVAMQQAGGSGAWETQQGSSAGEVWAAAERAQWREEWLANEAALGQ
ncbi:hypothetical protein C0989_005835, partial [Termitomyces sp. Mn162]